MSLSLLLINNNRSTNQEKKETEREVGSLYHLLVSPNLFFTLVQPYIYSRRCIYTFIYIYTRIFIERERERCFEQKGEKRFENEVCL